MSEVKELDATSSWESAVDTDAAIIAASRKPAIAGGKNFLAITINTVFCAPWVRSSSPTIILARYAMKQAAPMERTTQTIATVADFLIMDGFSIDIKRMMIRGMPK